jgi:serine/threonine protein kinase
MLLTKIKNCEYSFPEEHWQGISGDAKDLIGQLLQTNANLRPTALQVLQHPWLQQQAPETRLQTPVVLSRWVSMGVR